LSRLNRPAVDAALSPLIEVGQVATCGMIELEVLFSARSPDDYLRLQRQLRDGFEQLAMPDDVWQRALEVQAVLAARSQHRGAALPDLLIAATAERHRVTVLHYDHEFDLIASVTGQQALWIVPRGTADNP
jgi:predicted nucleic acid-binding protein